jgi:hypothetical protein
MARTIRRSDHGKRINALNKKWNRDSEAIGLSPVHLPDWRIFSDAFGADSGKPFKRARIDEHTSSVRRFVRNALTRHEEPVVCNDRSPWYGGVGATGITIPIEEAS